MFAVSTDFTQILNATPIESGPSVNTKSSSSSSSLSLSSTGRSIRAKFSASGPLLSHTKIIATLAMGSLLFIELIIFEILAWRKNRRREIAAATCAINEGTSSASEDTRPGLLKKSELDAEEARKHELHVEEQRQISAGSSIREMQDGDKKP